MFGRTNQAESTKWMPWVNLMLLLIVIGGGLFIFTISGLINTNVWMNNPLFQVIIPSLQLLTYSSIDAINQFGGYSADSAQFWKSGLISAAGLLIAIILAPWLFVKGYFAMEKSEKPNKTVSVWYIGAAVIIISIMVASSQITMNLIQNHDMKNRIEANRSMDELRGVMIGLSFDAAQQLILSPDTDDDATPEVRLESLPSFSEWDKFEIHINEQLGDSVLTLTGTLRDKNLVQALTQRSTVTMRITPQNDTLIHF